MRKRNVRRTGVARRGLTLAEVVSTLAIVALLTGLGFPRIRRAQDRYSVRAAAQEASAVWGQARRTAISRRAAVAVRVDAVGGRLVVHSGPDTILKRALDERYGVRVSGTRDSMAFDPRGLGHGAANMSVVFQRGVAAETLIISRLGRIRR